MMKILIINLILLSSAFANFNLAKDKSFEIFKYENLRKKIARKFKKADNWPDKLNYKDNVYNINYHRDEKLTNYLKKILLRHRSDYTSIVVIDNKTGNVLSAVDYIKSDKKFTKKLSFSISNPAASLIKVVTAADLFKTGNISKSDVYSFNGRASTLYKYQLRKRKSNRWTRYWTFKKAFALSSNVVFGKAAQETLTPKSLYEMAEKFQFNSELNKNLSLGQSSFDIADNQYQFAEFASGFNKNTLISPLHGAVMASIIANDGKYYSPNLINSIVLDSDQSVIWESKPVRNRVLKKKVTNKVKELMEYTVKHGTARSSFRRFNHNDYVVGGKTGSITGGEPFGKRDWFISYAKQKDSNDKGISICVMIVNKKKWYVKSPYLAKKIIQYYYSELKNI